MTVKGKVAIVTGGAQGIGRAITGRLLEEGLKVVMAEVDAEAGREALALFRGKGAVAFVRTDVSREAMVKKMVSSSVKIFGGVDFLVNNAGITKIIKPLSRITLAEWNRVIGVNLTGAFLCAKYAAPHLKKRKGAIVNIASVRAIMTEDENEAYSASKGGILALTMALAMSLGPDVRVNSVSPGWIDVSEWRKKSKWRKSRLTLKDHSQHPAGRVGRPEDIASSVFFLLSPESSFITAANFVVDGGMIKKMVYV